MGIRPLAISWPPARRAADAKGAAHRFSQMSTPAVLPGSIAFARCSTSSAARRSASCASTVASSPSSPTSGGSILVLGQDQYVDHADGSGVDQREQLFRHLPGEVARPRWKLDHEVVDRTEFIERPVSHYRLSCCHLILLSLLARHRDAQALFGRDQVVGVLSVLAEVDLHPVDRAGEDAALALVIVADRGGGIASDVRGLVR